MGSYFVEIAKIRYGWRFIWLRMQKLVQMEFYFVENVRIKYDKGFILLKILK